jgi:hypothetical protein
MWICCILAGMISLEASVVVYLLQGYVASGRQVRQDDIMTWKGICRVQD